MKLKPNSEVDIEATEGDLLPVIKTLVTPWVRTFRAYNDGENPRVILLPRINEVTIPVNSSQSITVQLNYKGDNDSDAASRPIGAKRTYKVVRAVSTSNSPEPESNKQE